MLTARWESLCSGQSRNFGNERIYSPGWEAKVFLKEGIGYTYPWIEEQVQTVQEER